MLCTYRLENLEIKQVTKEGQNKGEIYVIGDLVNQDNEWAKSRKEIIWRRDKRNKVDIIRKAYPKGDPWHGTNEEIDKNNFDPVQAEETLRNVNGKDILKFPNGIYRTVQLGGLYVQQYNTDLGVHRAGEFILEPNSKFIKVLTETKVFCMLFEERYDPQTGKDISDYVEGYFPEDGLKRALRNLIPVEALTPEQRALINPKWGLDIAPRSITPPSNDNPTADTATSGGTDDVDF